MKIRSSRTPMVGIAVLAVLAMLQIWPVTSPVVIPSAMAQDKAETKADTAAASSKSTSSEPKDESASSSAEEENAAPALGTLFPVGREFRGVKIPSYSGDILSSVVTADTMIRVDDEHMEMETLVITLFGGPEEDDTFITTDRGVYDMKKETLTSRSTAYIEREGQLDMVGDRMIFSGAKQQGRLIGNVKMRIYNISENFGNP